MSENKYPANMAEEVEVAYSDAQWDGCSSESCWASAMAVANAFEVEGKGREVSSSNDGERFPSDYPSVEFEFVDGSSCSVTYGDVFVSR